MANELWAGWDSMLNSHDNSQCCEDLAYLRARVEVRSQQLFSSEEDVVKILQIVPNEKDVQSSLLIGRGNIEKALIEIEHKELSSAIFILKQEYSWGCFTIQDGTFWKLMASQKVCPPFLDFLCAFGSRTQEIHDIREGYYKSASSISRSVKMTKLEFIYNLKYMDLHGRDTQNPWSLREMCVYQQYDLERKQTKWILLQPPDRLTERIEGDRTIHANVLHLHILCMSVAESNWSSYITYLQMEVAREDERACFSKVNSLQRRDYEVSFANVQKLQLVRRRLFRSQSALESGVEITNGLIELCKDCGSLSTDFEAGVLPAKMRNYSSRLRGHRRRVLALLRYMDGSTNLLSQIIEFRNDETLKVAGQALHANVDILKAISMEAKQESASLTSIARRGQSDSTTLKALSRIAMLYLPATLIATIFSSSLIQIDNDATNTHVSTHFRLVDGFWLYVVLTISLTGLTVCITVLFEGRWFPWRGGASTHSQI